MKITNIKYVKNDGAQIITDGDLCFVIDDMLVHTLGLEKDAELDEALCERLDAEAKRFFALSKAYSSLSRGDFSKKGLEKRLREKGADPEAARKAAEYMCEKGYVDDMDFARRICRVYSCEKSLGRRRVSEELRRRGVDRETAEQAMNCECIDDRENIEYYFEKKFHGAELSDPKIRKKAAAALARAGYGWEAVNLCLRNSETT